MVHHSLLLFNGAGHRHAGKRSTPHHRRSSTPYFVSRGFARNSNGATMSCAMSSYSPDLTTPIGRHDVTRSLDPGLQPHQKNRNSPSTRVLPPSNHHQPSPRVHMAMGGQQPTAHALDTTRAVIVSGQTVAGVGGMTALHSPPALLGSLFLKRQEYRLGARPKLSSSAGNKQ
jgi:hypothetical protein